MQKDNLILKNLSKDNKAKNIIKKVLPKTLLKNVNKKLNKDNNIRIYSPENLVSINLKDNRVEGAIPVFYWDRVANFGDVIGPYLISKITGKPILNIVDNNISGLMAVGSIIQSIDREEMTIWGSGLINIPDSSLLKDLRKYSPHILSVRGKETAKYLTEAGLDVPHPSVYGDPALTMPRFYSPKISTSKKIGICPHFVHKPSFLNAIDIENNLKIIDVQSNLESVIDEISSSSICISTSLHGLIIAQAYNIPWVWLEIIDESLIGNDFKFRDFFSTLNQNDISHVKVKLDQIGQLNFYELAEKASLPSKLYDEDLILKVLIDHIMIN